MINNLNATPWDPSGVTTTTVPRMQTSLTRGEPPGIVGARARPLVAGCAACEHRGTASHGHRHSVVCQRTFARWLTSQTQAKPRADEAETAQEVPVTTPSIPRTRLRGKTTPPNLTMTQEPIPSSIGTPTLEETATTTGERTTGLKRAPDQPVEEIDAARGDQPQHDEPDADVEMSIVESLKHILAMEMNTEENLEDDLGFVHG